MIVLLDSDSSGNDAKKKLTQKGYGPGKKPPLKKDFVFQVGELANLGIKFPEKLTCPEIEDLIPMVISVKAAQKYALEVCGIRERDVSDIKEEDVQRRLEEGETMYDAVNMCVKMCSKDEHHLEKIGFARSVVEVVNALGKQRQSLEPKDIKSLEEFEHNFKILFRELDKRKSFAELERTKEKASQKLRELEERFFGNHPNGANREDAVEFLDKLEALLLADDSFESDPIKKSLDVIRNEYNLKVDLEKRIDKYEQFQSDVKRLKYEGKFASQPSEDENLDITAEDISSTLPSLSELEATPKEKPNTGNRKQNKP